MGLDARTGAGKARADLEHVCAEAVFLTLDKMIGIVLHEAGRAVAALAHGLQDGGHGGDLPVALAAVAIALRHQVLRGQTGQLLHAVEVLERVGKGLAALAVHHLLHGDLFARLIADGVDIVRRKVILLAVDVHECVDLGLRDGVHLLDEIADGPGVDLPAELTLHLDLIALGDGDFAHVVAEAHDLQAAGEGDADGDLHPAGQTLLHVAVLPVTGNDLARSAQAGADEAVLAVAVGSLIQVHEVHVDLFVRDLTVILRGEVAPRLLEQLQTVDPHLGRGERMAPRHDTGAGVVIVGFLHDVEDLGVALGGDLVLQGIGQNGRKLLRHFLGAGSDGAEHLFAVQRL